MWIAVGQFLIRLATEWLLLEEDPIKYLFVFFGITLGFIKYRITFLKVINKNIIRIEQRPGKLCAFSFLSWKNYVLVGFMMLLGITLRHSPIPKLYLSILYIGIGLGLILGSITYFKASIKEIKAYYA
ncbi:MAG: hypothetical protein CL663_01565 [Bacteroidetes bacterium]|nr:hypothetical protein [Bacteroidota bacterium]